jgi:hypothetical protein
MGNNDRHRSTEVLFVFGDVKRIIDDTATVGLVVQSME